MSDHNSRALFMSSKAIILTLPTEIILQIICGLRYCDTNQIHDLQSLFATCKRINKIMVLRRKEILGYFVTIESNEHITIYKFMGKLHRGNDLPAVVEIRNKLIRPDKPMIRETWEHWCEHEQFHRAGRPAYIHTVDSKPVCYQWWTRGQLIQEMVYPLIFNTIIFFGYFYSHCISITRSIACIYIYN